MPAKKQSRGTCIYCGAVYTRAGTTKHLAVCSERQAAIEATEQAGGAKESLYHLVARSAYSNDFWLHLEIAGSRTLNDLDHYLRAIWLECCGHLSQFSIGGWQGDEIDMRLRIAQVFKPDVELTHIYDFGTSSYTLIKAVGTRTGNPTTSHPIALMARNLMPENKCIECGQPAGWLCIECLIENDIWGVLCETHVKTHHTRVTVSQSHSLTRRASVYVGIQARPIHRTDLRDQESVFMGTITALYLSPLNSFTASSMAEMFSTGVVACTL